MTRVWARARDLVSGMMRSIFAPLFLSDLLQILLNLIKSTFVTSHNFVTSTS